MSTTRRRTALAIGILVTLVFAGSVVFGLNATHGMPLVPRKTLNAAFHDVGGLVEGDDVRIASSRVGYVDDIRVENGQAVAVLKIDDPDMKVYRNATATNASVGARSALGQKFVDLNPGSADAGELTGDTMIPEPVTQGAQEITDLFTVFDPATRLATRSVIGELGTGMAGHGQDLGDLLARSPKILGDIGTVSRALTVNGGADLTGMLRSANTLAGRFTGRQNELAGLTRQLGSTLDALAVDGGDPVRDALRAAPETLRDAKGALNNLNRPLADTKNAAAALRPGAQSLGAATPDVRGVFREAVPPLGKVPGVAGHADPALDALTGLMADARPVSDRLVETTTWAATPLAVLAPYSGEITDYFKAGANALSHGDAAGNWLRIYLVPRTESVTGVLPTKDPLVSRNPYPRPGQAAHDSAPSPILGGPR